MVPEGGIELAHSLDGFYKTAYQVPAYGGTGRILSLKVRSADTHRNSGAPRRGALLR
jgi:hypothetical protein